MTRLVLSLAIALSFVSAQEPQGADPYAPVIIQCPDNLVVRRASEGLSDAEQAWRSRRAQNIIPALSSYLQLANVSGLDVESFTGELNETSIPKIGLAISGGGTQSGVGGLGIWEAFDARSSTAQGSRTGGIAQLLMYLTGLSGGGAVTVSTIASNNFTTLDGIRNAVNFSVDYARGPGGNANQSNYFEGIFEDAGTKAAAGFPVSVADTFGRFWATYLPQDQGYSNYSDIALPGTAFNNGDAPMPIITLTEVIPGVSPSIGGILYPANGGNLTNGFNITSYEVTPFEFGSWAGGRVQAFMPTRYVGTAMTNGSVQNSSECVAAFDKFTFVQGSTADAFSAWFIDDFYNIPIFAKRSLQKRQESSETITIPPDQGNNPLVQLVNSTAEAFNLSFSDAMWATWPNPFENFNQAMNNVSELLLVDGSLAGETNPIRPLIIPDRELDLVIVYESGSDSPNSWVNGTNLVNSARSAEEGNIPFPQIPDVATMTLQSLNRQPTFFGCNDALPTPLVLYLPNAPWSSYSNFSYEKPFFTDAQFDATVNNAFNIATYGNGTVDPEWPQCLACAVLRGAMLRSGQHLPEQCVQCFQRHCWNGTVSSGELTIANFDLRPRLNESLTYQQENATVWSVGSTSGGGTGGNNSGGGSSGSGSGSQSSDASVYGSQNVVLLTSIVLVNFVFAIL